jgi:hypothetical protein
MHGQGVVMPLLLDKYLPGCTATSGLSLQMHGCTKCIASFWVVHHKTPSKTQKIKKTPQQELVDWYALKTP